MNPQTKMKRAALTLALLIGCVAVLPAQGSGSRVRRRCEDLLQRAQKAGITVGFLAQQIDAGRPLLARNEDEPLIPASNMKLVTCAAAVLGLGPDHQIMTDLLAHGRLEGGVLKGPLRLRGEGDPTLRSAGKDDIITRFVTRLERVGIREIAADLLVDDRLFDREFTGPQWPKASPTKTWMAQVSALSLDHGTVRLSVDAGSAPGRPARVRVRPAGAGVTLSSALTTTRRRKDHVVDVQRAAGSNRLSVRGKVVRGTKDAAYEIAIHDPAMVFGRALSAAMDRKGIVLRGTVRRPEAGELRKGGRLVARKVTPLTAVMPELLRRSQNHRAEMLWKHLGAAVAHEGSFAGGGAACREIFAKKDIELTASVLCDGSGLSRANRLTARELAAILRGAWASPHRSVFREALPGGGMGTLRRRLKELGGRVRAKTGTLRGVSALSGYLETDGGASLVFVILMNGKGVAASKMRGLQDELVRALSGLGRGS